MSEDFFNSIQMSLLAGGITENNIYISFLIHFFLIYIPGHRRRSVLLLLSSFSLPFWLVPFLLAMFFDSFRLFFHSYISLYSPISLALSFPYLFSVVSLFFFHVHARSLVLSFFAFSLYVVDRKMSVALLTPSILGPCVALVYPVLSLDIATFSFLGILFVFSFVSTSSFLSFISLFPFFHLWSLFFEVLFGQPFLQVVWQVSFSG
jgi:hypothetical protein